MQPINPNDYRHPRTLKEAYGPYASSNSLYTPRRTLRQKIGRWCFSETIHIALIIASAVFMVFVFIDFLCS